MKRVLYILLAVLPLVSCVKQDRSDCPCYLLFSHGGFDAAGFDGNVQVDVFDGPAYQDGGSHSVSELIEDEPDIEVRRGLMDVCCIGGIDRMYREVDTRLLITKGEQCDAVYAFCDFLVDTNRERAQVNGTLNKQFAVINVTLVMPEPDVRHILRYTGNSVGFDVRSLKPVGGEFRYLSYGSDDDKYSVRIPRQLDNSLFVEIFRETVIGVPSEIEGFEKVSSINIGRFITDGLGYDWSAESLSDIDIVIDYVGCTVSVKIKDWNVVRLFTIEI